MKSKVNVIGAAFVGLFCGLAAFASRAETQPAPAPGPCAASPAAPCAGGPGAGMGGGMGGNMGRGGMGMRFGRSNTPGWSLLSPEERTAHRERMLAAKSYDECKAVQAAQHQIVVERAKERGVTLPTPRRNGCDVMQSRGLFR